MYYSLNTTNYNRSTRLTPYVCLKARWVLDLLFNRLLLTSVLVALVMVFLETICKTLNSGGTASSTTSLSAELQLGGINVTVPVHTSNASEYVDSVFDCMRTLINTTIETSYSLEKEKNKQYIAQFESIRDSIVSNLKKQSKALDVLVEELKDDTLVALDNDIDWDGLTINYTWISSDTISTPIEGQYSKLHANLSTILNELDEIKDSCYQSTEYFNRTNRASDIDLELAAGDPTDDSNTAKTSPHSSSDLAYFYLLGSIAVAYALAVVAGDYIDFSMQQRAANRLQQELKEVPDSLSATYRTIYGLQYNSMAYLVRLLGIPLETSVEVRLNWFCSLLRCLPLESIWLSALAYLYFKQIHTSSITAIYTSTGTRNFSGDVGIGQFELSSYGATSDDIFDDCNSELSDIADKYGLGFLTFTLDANAVAMEIYSLDGLTVEVQYDVTAAYSTNANCTPADVQMAFKTTSGNLFYYTMALCVGSAVISFMSLIYICIKSD